MFSVFGAKKSIKDGEMRFCQVGPCLPPQFNSLGFWKMMCKTKAKQTLRFERGACDKVKKRTWTLKKVICFVCLGLLFVRGGGGRRQSNKKEKGMHNMKQNNLKIKTSAHIARNF